MYTYKEGYREGVVFVFAKDDKILIEKRPTKTGYDIFFPSGSIEERDQDKSIDYRVHALHREVGEAFQDKVSIKKHMYLGEIKEDSINVIFYVYLITDWCGDIPSYIVENGEIESDVLWIKFNERREYFVFDSAFEICNRIENCIEISIKNDKQT